MSIVKKLLSYLFLFFALSLIVNLSKDVWRLLHADERIAQTEQKLTDLKQENSKLKQEHEYRQQDAYIEEEIRNKLQMAKPGETIVVLPEDLSSQVQLGSQDQDSAENKNLKNWQKWLELFI
jgi:cell division protein FtsB